MMEHPHRHSILIVDDQPTNIKVLFELLQQTGFRVSVAKSGESALIKAEQAAPDLMLLDIMMPGINGYETCRRLKAQPATCEIPVIFLSALDQALDKVEAFAVGGADYIAKPFQTEEVLARVRHQLELRTAKAELITLNANLEERIQERTAQLVTTNESLTAEISQRHRAEADLRHSALHDALTQLPNRVLFMEHLAHAQKRSQRSEQSQFAVLFIDLDRFKTINDSLGHQAGDQLLIAVAQRLKQVMRDTDVLARLGGDEFIVLVEPVTSVEDTIQISERIVQAFQPPFDLNGQPVFTTASIGIALSSMLEDRETDLLRNADIAMYRAKARGKSRFEVFDQQMYTQALARHQLENDLRRAVEQQEFTLHYQPIMDLSSEKTTGFEALIRWQHPVRGVVPPLEFIPLAEEMGLIVSIGEWVLHTACQQLAQWQARWPQAADLSMSVNLSVKQLKDPKFLSKIDHVLLETGLQSQSLQLELTESMLMDDSDTLIDLLTQLVDRGIQLSIDDFGTGYSSLSYLHRFPIYAIKVDQSFIRPMQQQREKRKIVETIISLAHQLGMIAIAEGIETAEHHEHLKRQGCEKGQGYLFAKPLSPEAAASFLDANLVTERTAIPSLETPFSAPSSQVNCYS
ncbi:MAG: EAL domain-containing protein [Thermosynechococcaceae cyanobacterium]